LAWQVAGMEDFTDKLANYNKLMSLADALDNGFGMILDALDQGIHIVDKEGKTIFYNQAMEKIEGLTKQHVLGKKLLEVFPSLTSDTSTLYKVLTTGKPVRDQVQNYTNLYGRQITTINSSVPILIQGKMMGAIELARDISVIRELQDKIIDLQQAFYRGRDVPGEDTGARYIFNDMIGETPALKKTIEHARRAARTNSSILLCGESGTGKEMIAQGIHNVSPRGQKPFIAHNCAALPDGLLEGILFGTCKGSFTGAVDRPGLFEQANGGTILLDEMNSMGLDLQAKLLRLLQEKKVRRLGSVKEIEIDVRVIATVNSNIVNLLERGEIRQDLFYRLGVVTINIPPLRERREDISLLTRYFIQKYNKLFGLEVVSVSPAVYDLFMTYHWPGNVRELMHVIEGAMNVISSEKVIDMDHLPQYIFYKAKTVALGVTDPPVVNGTVDQTGISNNTAAGHGRETGPGEIKKGSHVWEEFDLEKNDLTSFIEDIEKILIEKALKKHSGNLSQASRELGIKRQSLQYKLQKYHIVFEQR